MQRWKTIAPGLAAVGGYRREFVRGDLVAGLAVTALLIPHGMAFASLAGVPAVTGLYATVAALLAYAVFGPSRLLLLGPDSSLAPLVAATIVLVGAQNDPTRAVATAGMLGLMTGAVCITAGVIRLGVLSELLSRPVRVGYLNGLVIVVIVGQLPALFGFPVDADSTIGTALEFIRGLVNGQTNTTVLALGAGAMAVIWGLRAFGSKVPGVLVAILGAILIVDLFDLTERGVNVIGAIPNGLPDARWPTIPAGDLLAVFLSSLGVSFITLTDTMALSRGFAGRTGDVVDPNREISALGAANVATGLFGGFPISASTTRTTLAHESGGHTQLVGVIGAALVSAVLVFGGGVVERLPSVALAAVVITAVIHLFDAELLRWLSRARPGELGLSVAATIGVVSVGVLEGIVVAVALSIAAFLRKAWRPHDAILGRVDGRKGYHDISRHPDAQQIPGLVIYRFDAPLFFANADYFAHRVMGEISAAPTEVQRVVVASEPITDIDSTAAEMLERLLDQLDARGITIAFAALKGPAKDRLRAYGLYDRIGDENFNSTLGTALNSYLNAHEVEWVDWTDRPRRRKEAPGRA